MRARVLVPVLLALAAVAGLIFGGFLPQGSLAAGATPAGGTAGGSPDSSSETGSDSADEPPADADFVGVTTPPDEQPQLGIKKLAPGERPPQFVVISFDGSCETNSKLFRHYLDTAEKVSGRFSFNISGLCIVPDNDQRMNYDPPNKARGTSAIGFGEPTLLADRINTWTEAYTKGHEMATHYLGHFCGSGGVQSWSTADWTSEIQQFNSFMDNWPKFNPGVTGVHPLPFNSSVIKGGRTPCLEGQRPEMYPAMVAAGYTYDSSNPGELMWPKKVEGFNLWDFPLQIIKVAGYKQRNLSMDYNFLVTQNDGQTKAEPEKCKQIESSTYDSLMQAGEAVYTGNRAPFFVGNHFNEWACGAYKNSLTRFIEDFKAQHPDVEFVSNLDLQKWLEAQDPAVLAQLQALPKQDY